MSVYDRPLNKSLGFIEDNEGVIKIEDIVIPAAPAPALTNEVPETRLIITELIIRDFKSYAGEHVLGPLNKNFTSVIGPNGSGKSNVIDALLFVFGYRSRKIRSKKISELVHKSDHFPNLTSCSVTVNFATIRDNGDEYTIIPDSRFIISRTATTDDTSYYEIDNRRAPYKEVARTLRAYGIDLEHNRFLILQGEIEAIALMNPKGEKEHETGMLEYIEDIIGSNRLAVPIEQFREKVEKLNEVKQEKLNILKLVEEEKNKLKGPKNKALEYLRLQNERYLLENSLLHLRRNNAEKELESALKSKKKSEDKLNDVKKKLEDSKLKKKFLESEMEKLNSEMEIKSKHFEQSKEHYQKCERADAECLENIKNAKNKVLGLEENLSDAKAKLDKLVKKLAVFEKETAELESKKMKLISDKEVEEKNLAEAMGVLSDEGSIGLKSQKEEAEKTLKSMITTLNEMESEVQITQSELNFVQSKSSKENQAHADLISKYEKNVCSLKSEEKIMIEEEEQIRSIENELAVLEQKMSHSEEEQKFLAEQYKSSRQKYEEARVSLQTACHENKMIQAFFQEKSSGRLPGVYGRLGNLGAINEKYDIAVSTACAQLDNVVTDTLSTAQQCVEFLKRRDLGYATFIPLDKMAKWLPYIHQKIETPENVPRLFDLITVKDKDVLPAFYHAVHDTLVADNLDQATRIGLQGRQRYRVVTLKGELIDLSGTMSGGGGPIRKGRMGQTIIECNVSSDHVSEMRQEVDRLHKNISDSKSLYLQLQDEKSVKIRKLKELQNSIKQRTHKSNVYKQIIENLQFEIDQQKEVDSCDVYQEKIITLEKLFEEKQKNFKQCALEVDQQKTEIKRLKGEIQKLSCSKVNKFKIKLKKIEKEMQDTCTSILQSSYNVKTAKQNMKSIQEKIISFENSIAENKALKVCYNEKLSTITNAAKEAIKVQENAEADIKLTRDKYVALRKHMEKLSAEGHNLKLKINDFKNEIKVHESCEAQKQSLLKVINGKFSELKLNEVDDETPEFPTLSSEEIEKLSLSNLTDNIEILKVQLEDMHPDIPSIKAYEEKAKLCEEKEKDLENVVQERNLQNARHEELRKRRVSEFMKGFTIISKKLKEIYQMLTLGGDAEIELVDCFDPFSKGVEFSIRPPKKSWKYMRYLSGGEKTLGSLALVFALHFYRPTPFYVMDEIDAALDFRNVAIVGFYLKERTKNTQFVVVSLRNIMNEISDYLVGIFKVNNCSQSVSISRADRWYIRDGTRKV